MAILVVKLENEASLMMNEFFDYNGNCWALTRTRGSRQNECIALEDFYECTIRTAWVDAIPVIFVLENQIIGWYKTAKVFRNLQIISAFLEGNVCARSLDVCLLSKTERQPWDYFEFKDKMYQVIEDSDECYTQLLDMIESENHRFVSIRFDIVDSFYSGDRVRMAANAERNNVQALGGATALMRDYCLGQSAEIAERVMNDQCMDIRELKTMYQYANQAVTFDKNSADGWYYLAMACEHLGFIKEGFKAIDRALKIESDGDDLLALKGHLLFALGKYEASAEHYEEAYAIQPVDGYLMCVGQAWYVMGNVDKAYKAYQRVKDKDVLEAYGINLKDMERRWPFVALRGFSFKDLFGRKKS